MNQVYRGIYILFVIYFLIFLMACSLIDYSVIGSSLGDGFNETKGSEQSGVIKVNEPYLSLIQSDSGPGTGHTYQDGVESYLQNWMDLNSSTQHTFQGNIEQSNQPSWMAPLDNLGANRTERSIELWIQGSAGASQYKSYPVGMNLQLLANAPASGIAEIHEISLQSRTVKSRKYQLTAGYSSIGWKPDQIGRYILLFTMNNLPSSAIIVDVTDSVSRIEGNDERIPEATPVD